MKARLKGTAEWLDVTALFYADGEHYGFRLGDDKEHYYYADALEFEREPDWDAFRREAAKDIVCALITGRMADKVTCKDRALMAISQADALIKELQKK